AEVAMAGSLIESMAGDFHPEGYTDNYRAALQEVIDAKVAGREIVAPAEEEPAPTAAVDLMAALRASVERARSARGEGGPTPIGAAKSARKKATPKKAEPAEKAPAKETAAKKAAEPAAKKTGAKKAAPAKKAARKSA